MLTEITLPNDTTPVVLEDCPKFGIFDIYIKPKESTDSDRPYARFHIGRSNDNNRPGQITRMISSKGKTDSQLDMFWEENGKPQIRYRPAPKDSPEPITYTVSIFGHDEHSRLEELEKRVEEQQKIIESLQKIDYDHIITYWFLKNERNIKN
jgi:hypothetical protein